MDVSLGFVMFYFQFIRDKRSCPVSQALAVLDGLDNSLVKESHVNKVIVIITVMKF